MVVFFFSSRRRHTRYWRDWSSDVCSSDLGGGPGEALGQAPHGLPTRCLLRRGHGRVPGRGRAPAGRGGLPAGVPCAACAPGLPGGGLRGGTVPTPEAAGTEGERPLGGEASVASTEAEGGAGERWALYRNGPLLLVASIAFLGLLAEGEMFHWSGIHLRDTLVLAALVGGSGVAVFYGAHALGRLAIGWVVGRAGNRRTLVGSGALAAVGMAFSLATTVPALVVGGVSYWWASGSRRSRPWPSRWPGIWCRSERAPRSRW